MTSMDLVAELIVDSQDYIGESPAWDPIERRLLWTDNVQEVVHEARPDGAGAWRETGRREIGRELSAVIPRAGGGLLLASGTELVFLDQDGEITSFASVDARGVEVRLNDGKCDARGRLWAGTLDKDIGVGGRPVTPGRCALYRIDPNGSVQIVLDGVTLSNGLDWSPDGRIFYYTDTVTWRIDAFDFDMDAGAIANRRTFVQLTAEDGQPDGLCVDTEGCLWVAVVGRSEVWRYAPNGERLGRVRVASEVTSCAFGGPDGGDLFITTARARLPNAILRNGFTHGVDMRKAVDSGHTTPGVGGLYRVRPGVGGPPARPFGG